MDHATTDDRNPVEAVEGVHLAQLAVGDRMSVQHVRIEPGAVVPEHDHPHEQVGFVYAGELVFVLEDGTERAVGPGGGYRFAGGDPHAAENRGDEAVRAIDVFSPPRADPDWQE